MTTYTHNGQEITPDALIITQLDAGGIKVENTPLPEYILVAKDLWDEAEVYDPQLDGDTGLEPPDGLWIEEIGHADEDVTNDGYILHVNATNVALGYKLLQELEDGNRLLQLVSWAEL